MRKPLVSICVPIYGVETYIEKCARSLFEQTYANIEYIFVDDCGTDKSISILQQVCQAYPQRQDQVHVIRHEKNRGLAAARNTAVENAHGEFIIHVDSDDWVETQMVELLVQTQQQTNADIVSGNAIAHYNGYTRTLIEPEYTDRDAMIKGMLELTIDHAIWRRLIRTTLYRQNGIRAIEGANIGEDHQVMPQLTYYAQSFARCEKIVYHYNCMNINSYVHDAGKKEFNRKKYNCDNRSIDILEAFFESVGEQTYIDLLEEIKARHIYRSFFPVLRYGEKDFYYILSQDLLRIKPKHRACLGLSKNHLLLLTQSYYINRGRAIMRALLRKTTGIEKINL